VSKGIDSLVGRLGTLSGRIVDEFKNTFTKDDGLINAIVRSIKAFWPIVDSFSPKPLVHVLNIFQNILFWSFAHFDICLSIAAHLLILDQIFIVIELWARRRDQLPGKGGDGDGPGSLSSGKESSSSSSSPTLSGDDADTTSQRRR
jgi:hypothetical protein